MVVPPAVGLRGHGASGRPRTACLPLTRGTLCRVSYRGLAGDPGFEPGQAWPSPGPEPGVLPITPVSIAYGRGESNSQTTRFERARYASSRHARAVRRPSLELGTSWLRARCSGLMS